LLNCELDDTEAMALPFGWIEIFNQVNFLLSWLKSLSKFQNLKSIMKVSNEKEEDL